MPFTALSPDRTTRFVLPGASDIEKSVPGAVGHEHTVPPPGLCASAGRLSAAGSSRAAPGTTRRPLQGLDDLLPEEMLPAQARQDGSGEEGTNELIKWDLDVEPPYAYWTPGVGIVIRDPDLTCVEGHAPGYNSVPRESETWQRREWVDRLPIDPTVWPELGLGIVPLGNWYANGEAGIVDERGHNRLIGAPMTAQPPLPEDAVETWATLRGAAFLTADNEQQLIVLAQDEKGRVVGFHETYPTRRLAEDDGLLKADQVEEAVFALILATGDRSSYEKAESVVHRLGLGTLKRWTSGWTATRTELALD